jgi:hypothetical protein
VTLDAEDGPERCGHHEERQQRFVPRRGFQLLGPQRGDHGEGSAGEGGHRPRDGVPGKDQPPAGEAGQGDEVPQRARQVQVRGSGDQHRGAQRDGVDPHRVRVEQPGSDHPDDEPQPRRERRGEDRGDFPGHWGAGHGARL